MATISCLGSMTTPTSIPTVFSAKTGSTTTSERTKVRFIPAAVSFSPVVRWSCLSRLGPHLMQMICGQVMAKNRIPMHGIASIYNEFGNQYAVPLGIDIGGKSSFHSCTPEVMLDL